MLHKECDVMGVALAGLRLGCRFKKERVYSVIEDAPLVKLVKTIPLLIFEVLCSRPVRSRERVLVVNVKQRGPSRL